MSKSFQTILAEYRNQSFSLSDLGSRFERLIRAYLLTDRRYTFQLKSVWLWQDFFAKSEFEAGGHDIGIDLVAETEQGDYWAIQCKCYQESKRLDKRDLDSFLASSGRSFHNSEGNRVFFTQRLLVSTTNDWTANAEEVILNQAIPVLRLSLRDLVNAPVDWESLSSGIFGEPARTTRYSLYPHQQIALENAQKYFTHSSRGKLIMACGTGKSFTSLRIAEQEAEGFALVLVPSIALVGQILAEWSAHALDQIQAICVCSQPKVSRRHVQSANDDLEMSIVDLAQPATTDPQKVLGLYHSFTASGMKVIFSTYQSIDVISEAQQLGLPDFGLIVCDEAHRTTGVTLKGKEESAFVRVHSNAFIKGKKRLYMTATPRLYNENSKSKAKEKEALLCSMDDPELYGEVIYHIGFGDAVEKGFLSDYKVLILTLSSDLSSKISLLSEGEVSLDDEAKIIGCLKALSKQLEGEGSDDLIDADPSPMRRAVIFNQTIKESQRISALFAKLSGEYIQSLPAEERSLLLPLEAHHVDGGMTAPKREERLSWLKEENSPDDDKCKLLSNVRCLSEGVDVPALDAVIFYAPRKSQIDIVQSVGRVMRKAPGKKFGYIIIPVTVTANTKPEDALNDNAKYKIIWDVLNALRAHDERFEAIINRLELNREPGKKGNPAPVKINIVKPVNHRRELSTETSIREEDEGDQQISFDFPPGFFETLTNIIYARLVMKVGTRTYWEDWAKSVADIAASQITRISEAVESGNVKNSFDLFLSEMRASIDVSLSKNDVIEMLAQHAITTPVFDALFEDYPFAQRNAVSIAMSLLLEELKALTGLEEDTKELAPFYASVKKRAEDIRTASGRQKVIIELYNNFFKAAFPKMSSMLGIVYTPVEVVDFIIHSVNDVLQQEFGKSLSDEQVNILDPFVGTGTFITRLLESGLINPADLPRKYQNEIFANELVLLAYYIACVNIENAYHEIMQLPGYEPFTGIALTDTFQAWESKAPQLAMLDDNSERVRRQNQAPITVIFGNPPYSAGQRSANDNAQNRKYANLDKRIAESYVALSDAKLNSSLYDSYIRAFRYATDRLADGDGIICFVSNGGWLDGNSTAGFRKSLEKEFSSIYIFNLRGNQRTSGELSHREGGKIFGSGSRTPVTITLLVKQSGYQGRARIFYRDIGDYLKREEKLAILYDYRSFLNPLLDLSELTPDEHGNWITERSEVFYDFIPLASEKKRAIETQSIFTTHSGGLKTSRDAWVYNYSRVYLLANMMKTIEYYNRQVDGFAREKNTSLSLNVSDFLTYDSMEFSWDRQNRKDLARGKTYQYTEDALYSSIYRPFQRQWCYFSREMNNCVYLMPTFFPTPDSTNLVIAMNSIGDTQAFSVFMSDTIVDLHTVGTSQCFPLYYYEASKNSNGQTNLLSPTSQYTRRDGISDFVLQQAHQKYATAITKEDIFYYVYGLLHNPGYRTAFADDLKQSLPRIPLLDNSQDFFIFSQVGRDLAHLHLNYEQIPPLDTTTVTIRGVSYRASALPAMINLSDLAVQKMRFPAGGRQDTIIVNDNITVGNIPLEAYSYIVNGKSAIAWIMDRYQITTDKASGIVNDPNLYAKENGKPQYILQLLLSVIAVSVKTMEIVNSLPELRFVETETPN